MLVLSLLLAYVGQSLLVVGAPCTMMGPASDQVTHGMAGTGHAGHAMDMAQQPDLDSGACCEGGFCSMSQCQSATALPATTMGGGLIHTGVFPPPYLSPSPNGVSTALFRPPILG